jgi:DNA end-binding protein Ku
MAPRAYWKGYLRLSLVSCPVQLFPATSEREKIRFHQLNKNTGNRVRYRKVDEDTGDEVEQSDIMKGYEVEKGQYLELTKEELEAVAVESTRMIDIEQFVPENEIDELYLGNPYYMIPDGEVGAQAFAVIREAIKQEGMVALGRVVFTSREHIISLKPRGKGLMGVTLRYPYEIREEDEYFDDVPDEKVTKDMLDLAKHIVEQKSGHFKPEKFEDRYEEALKDLLKKKQHGEKIVASKEKAPSKVINLMDALRRSAKGDTSRPGQRSPARRKADKSKKATRSTARHHRKAG